MLNNKITYIIVFFILFSCSFVFQNENEFEIEMKKCDRFVQEYKHTYVVRKDTMIVSRFTQPPEEINNFLFRCIEEKRFEPLKYSIVIVMKQNTEYANVNKQDYMIGDNDYSDNGFVELVRKAMNVADSNSGYSFPYYTGEVCEWAHKHKEDIIDYDYINNYLENSASSK